MKPRGALHQKLENALDAISPLDGRYKKYTAPIASHMSERALFRARAQVEVEYLVALSESRLRGLRRFNKRERALLQTLPEDAARHAAEIKMIETQGNEKIPRTTHDVKALEYYLKECFSKTSLKDSAEWIHFGLTSEDVNNIAYGLILCKTLEQALIPAAESLVTVLASHARRFAAVPMLSRTHGQPASPTTLGKEFGVFALRLRRQLYKLRKIPILLKLNGATGNFNAHVAAYPAFDWIRFSERFIRRFNNRPHVLIHFEPNMITTQIEPHDTYAEIFDCIRRLNTIVIDLNQDMWRYVSDGWLAGHARKGEVGSSTMPHKLNPTDFESSEGNCGIANTLLTFFSTKLPISRLQRDLSDSTVERNFGVALAHSFIAWRTTEEGLRKTIPQKSVILNDLLSHPEVVTEALQTILRKEGIGAPYEKLRDLTRGKKINMKTLESFIDSLPVERKLKRDLKKITPQSYIGLARILAERAAKDSL